MHACNNVILFILQKTRSIILNWIIYVKNKARFGERNNLLDLCPIWKDGKELYQISFHLNVYFFLFTHVECVQCTVQKTPYSKGEMKKVRILFKYLAILDISTWAWNCYDFIFATIRNILKQNIKTSKMFWSVIPQYPDKSRPSVTLAIPPVPVTHTVLFVRSLDKS